MQYLRRRSRAAALPLIALALGLALALAPTACGGPRAESTTARPSRQNLNQLTREELASGAFRNAYEMIEALRPRWLRSRGAESFEGEAVEVQVYLDGQRLGGVSHLRAINVSEIVEAQFVDPVTAAGRWGADHHNGVILISTRAR